MGFLKNLFSVIEKVNDVLGEDNLASASVGRKGKVSKETICRERIEEVISTEYMGYELRKNIPSTEMYAPQDAVAYSYGIYNNGYPVLFINIIVDRNDYRTRRYRLAKKASEDNGVPHLNFFCHLPNEKEYISNRIRSTLIK
jgi:hypothetical protein